MFVPLGMGSGICGLIAMRNMLGLKTKIIGVVAEQAPAFARSFQARRVSVAEALEVVLGGAADIVAVSEDEIAQAIRTLYEATRNIAEGAGAAAYAALKKTRSHYQGKRVAVVLSGGHIDRSVAKVLAGLTPEASPRLGGGAPVGAGARGAAAGEPSRLFGRHLAF